ncbi:MAG: hypothetical protein R2856_25035 [Caldilineaceae bacterium]
MSTPLGADSRRGSLPMLTVLWLLDGIAPTDGVLLALSATALHGADLIDPQPGQRLLPWRGR